MRGASDPLAKLQELSTHWQAVPWGVPPHTHLLEPFLAETLAEICVEKRLWVGVFQRAGKNQSFEESEQTISDFSFIYSFFQ